MTKGAVLPADAQTRKNAPMARGLLDYFPLALAAVAELSRIGNEQHNPGQPMHWAREKSTDHADCIVRHLIDRGTLDTDGQRHATKVAWRALALLELELEADAQPVIRPEPVFSYDPTICSDQDAADFARAFREAPPGSVVKIPDSVKMGCVHSAYTVHSNGIERSCAGCGAALSELPADELVMPALHRAAE